MLAGEIHDIALFRLLVLLLEKSFPVSNLDKGIHEEKRKLKIHPVPPSLKHS